MASLDHLEPLGLDGRPGERRQLERRAVGDHEAARTPHHGVDDHRQARTSSKPGQPFESAGVIEVAMAEDDRLDRARVDLQPLHVVGHAVARDARVEEHAVRHATAADGHERREAVLSDEPSPRLTAVHDAGRDRGQFAERRSPRNRAAAEQRVVAVVDEHRDHDLVDRLQVDRVARAARNLARRDRPRVTVPDAAHASLPCPPRP